METQQKTIISIGDELIKKIDLYSTKGSTILLQPLSELYSNMSKIDLKDVGEQARKIGHDFEEKAHEWLVDQGYQTISRNLDIIIRIQNHPSETEINNLVHSSKLDICYKHTKTITKEIDGIYLKNGILYWVEMKSHLTETFIPSVIKLVCMVHVFSTLYPLYPEIFTFKDSDGNFSDKADQIIRYVKNNKYSIVGVSTQKPPQINQDTILMGFVPDFRIFSQDLNPESVIRIGGKDWNTSTQVYKIHHGIFQCAKRNFIGTNSMIKSCSKLLEKSPRFRGFIHQLERQKKKYIKFKKLDFLPLGHLGDVYLLPSY